VVGLWRVTGATGEPSDTVLRLAADDGFGLTIFRKCGQFSGAWAASTDGAFVGSIDGYSMACMATVHGDDATPTWLSRTRGYRVRGGERDLLAADGSVTATLERVTRVIHPAPGLIKSMQQPPTLDPATVRKLRTAARPLPSGTISVTPKTLLGAWVPYPKRQYANGKNPSASFGNNGNWSASDGCNGTAGRWTLSTDGELVTTVGASTLIGCDGAPTASWVSQARRAAISGDVLTLYAPDGKLVARLTR
jgi:heat shock protein HslJ